MVPPTRSEDDQSKEKRKRIELTDSSEAEYANALDHRSRLALRPWRVRFWDQFTVLTYKQALVYLRNLRSTLLRILSPFFFMFLLWLLNIAIQSNNVAYSAVTNVPNPSPSEVAGFPSCTSNAYILPNPCWDFFYTPNTSAVATSIATNMRTNNPGRPIPLDRVLSFASIDEANAWLYANPQRVIGGVHFLMSAATSTINGTVDYVIQTNSTTKFFKQRYQDPTFYSAVPLQVLTEREIARYIWATKATAGNQSLDAFSWNVSVSQFAHPETGSLNIVGQVIGPFVFAANMFNFVLLLSSIVSERERGLRQALTTGGMLDSAFWLSWMTVEALISVVFSLLIIAFGAMFNFAFFLDNSFALLFLLFLLFQWAMVSVAFILSAFVSKTTTAINLGFVIFILGWVVQAAVDFNFPYSPDYYSTLAALTAIFTLLPFATLAKASLDLGAAAESIAGGLTWSRRNVYCQNIKDPAAQDALFATDPKAYWDFNCVFPIGNILTILAIEFFVYAIIAVYLDNVIPDANGVRKGLFYFLNPQYWSGTASVGLKKRGSSAVVRTPCGLRALRAPVPHTDAGEADPDVAAEESEMKQLQMLRAASMPDRTALATADGTNAVEVYGLQKAFGRPWCSRCSGKSGCGCMACFPCCGGTKRSKKRSAPVSKEFWAIKGSWFAIERGHIFCLLGPNGAGKTTTINCLTGVLRPTGGDALIYGESITAPGGLDRIRSVMGVCPQFDVLWGELTAAEHLYIYGRVKGLPRKDVTAQGAELLEQVKLTRSANQKTAIFSGGMKRRLSVAIALLGDPLIVFLDEPTTGMDPISRRHVWDAIEAAKPGRAIVLTTHSMEEADILGDRVAIMARGRVRAFGSSLRLKQRFGSGYSLSVAIGGSSKSRTPSVGSGLNGAVNGLGVQQNQEAVIEFFKKELGVSPAEGSTTGQYTVFLVPKDKETELSDFLGRLEEHRKLLHVTDVQISLTSLEDVFLNIAKKAEMEAAAAEGRLAVEVLLEDGSILDVDLGEELVEQESTGKRFKIKWVQDEEGRLQVLSCTEESQLMAVSPPNQQARMAK